MLMNTLGHTISDLDLGHAWQTLRSLEPRPACSVDTSFEKRQLVSLLSLHLWSGSGRREHLTSSIQ